MSRFFEWHMIAGVSSATTLDAVRNFAGDQVDDYDIEAAHRDFVTAVRDALPDGARLQGETFSYEGTWATEDAAAEIADAVDQVDLAQILAAHELAEITPERFARVTVARGVAALDEYTNGTVDWRSRIDTDILDLRLGNECILGQLFLGGYVQGLDALDIDASAAWRYGFAVRRHVGWIFEESDALWQEWIKAL